MEMKNTQFNKSVFYGMGCIFSIGYQQCILFLTMWFDILTLKMSQAESTFLCYDTRVSPKPLFEKKTLDTPDLKEGRQVLACRYPSQ